MKKVFIFLLLLCNDVSYSQVQDLYREIYKTYPEYKIDEFKTRRFEHPKVKEQLKEVAKDPAFSLQEVGRSIEGRELYLLSTGTGKTNIFLWSQMHGDESTATMALFDIFNFLRSEGFEEEKQELLKNVRLHFLPMVNPDGAERFERRNTLNIDLNRDALRLQSPESQTLKRVRDSIKPEFGFNLHDQSKYYNVGLTR
ncbi:hypothetical protein LZ575_11585 [Antarcticibacterium sp. 1MA-6-2]|uniref:M14 family zinc carboxypeptidase n=1 Tax=Antarcticibacterium sp. 1MA-6-2 TaxID=2908210 RepID=UPI001F1F3406|nr:M14 family zinc carboxypeptidase [Antarcticibacterium sp. 1MA-6-2]UJH89705.1 hypothetical protein LZ575_11585 [Antarcticibacterium sp. 1MA-6-2]